MGGRCAVIVPDGVLFGSQKPFISVRKRIMEETRLEAVVSMPSGVFEPYAGVSTAILLFAKGGKTDQIWYYDMAYDGYSLDKKRQPTPGKNDIPDIIDAWKNRFNGDYQEERKKRVAELKAEVAPLKEQRLAMQADMNRLQFEQAIAPEGEETETAVESYEADKKNLDEIEAAIAPIQAQIDQLTRQFWVDKADVIANNHDLTPSRYQEIEQDDTYYEDPEVTMDRLAQLESKMTHLLEELRQQGI